MKKLIMTAAILGLTATGAAAQTVSASQEITIGASVDKFCAISGAANTVTNIPTVAATGLTSGSPTAPTFNVTCNAASNVTLTSANGAVTLGDVPQSGMATPPGGFRNAIEYVATINGGAGDVTLDTSSVNTVGPSVFNAGAVVTTGTTVTITPETSTVPLLAGSYTDRLTVAIVPN